MSPSQQPSMGGTGKEAVDLLLFCAIPHAAYGLLDHLLKHMDGRVPDSSTEWLRCRHNEDGAMVKRQVEELAEELNDVKRHMEQLNSNMVELGKEAKSEAERSYSSWKLEV